MRADTRPDPTRESNRVAQMVTLAVTLLLLVGITYLTMRVAPPEWEGGRTAILTGFVLLVASVAGALANRAGLPRLTGFIVVGILAGPSVLALLSDQAVQDLRLIDEFALALIALLAGGELKIEALRPRARTIAFATLAVTLLAWAGMAAVVAVASPLLPFLDGVGWRTILAVALLLGVWSANSSPDLTVAVIEETGAKGALTDVILGVTIVKDVVVIVLFTLTLALVEPLLVPNGGGFDPHVLWELAREVGGALVVGTGLGWIFSLYLQGGEGDRPPIATFLFAYVLVVVAGRLHVELLLTAVAAGFVIENLSPAGDRMIRGIESVSVVIFAFFFAIAGASLDLAAIRSFWLAALILFGARILFTWAGARYGIRLAGAGERIRRHAWKGLISQGGVTLGLLLLIERSYPEIGAGVMSLGMAVIIGNILGGPILLKWALSEGG